MGERDLFLTALDLSDPAERAEYLNQVCAGDAALRSRLDTLLAAHAGAGEFLNRPAVERHADMLTDLPDVVLSDSSSQGGMIIEPPSDSVSTGAVTISSPETAGDQTQASPYLRHSHTAPAASELVKGTEASSAEQWPAGKMFGRYRIERLLGRGGMGLVYLAEDTRLGRHIALKIPRFDISSEMHLVKRFQREARAMASLRHRNLCAVYDVGEEEGVQYLTMEYIEGQPLSRVLASGQQFAATQIAELIRRIALAMQKAHDAGVVHRDLKPANIMIDAEGEPVIMDFGLARWLHEADASVTQSGVIIGTPLYMAPEQAEGVVENIGPHSDQYSLGAIFYELLTGRTIHQGSVSRVLARLMLDTPVPRPSTIRMAINPALEAICLRMVSQQPSARYPDLRVVADELQRFCRDHQGTDPSLTVQVESGAKVKKTLYELESPLPARLNDELLATEVLPVARSAPARSQRLVFGFSLLLVVLVTVMAIAVARRPQPDEPNSSELQARTTATAKAAGSATESVDPVTAEPAGKPSGPSGNAVVTDPGSGSLILSDIYEWSDPRNAGPGINSDRNEDHAALSADGLLLIFAREDDSGRYDLWWSIRSNLDELFPVAARMPDGINSEFNETNPFLSQDRLALWFVSDRPGGPGHNDVYVARRNRTDESFGQPELVGHPFSTPESDYGLAMSPDELTAIFSRGFPHYLYRVTRTARDLPFGEPQLMSGINSGVWQEFPCLTADGRSVLYMAGEIANGSISLWISHRADVEDEFDPPVKLGPQINDHSTSGPSISSDGGILFFSSSRPGTSSHPGHGNRDLWFSHRIKRPDPETLVEQASRIAPLATAPFDGAQHQAAWADALKIPVESINSQGMKMRLIPPGEFLMGAPDSDPDAQPAEKPQHSVLLTKPFRMSATEVTNGQFRAFVESRQFQTDAESDGRGAYNVNPKERRAQLTWHSPSLQTADDFPVRCVSWNDARRFCDWLTLQNGMTYRLPTEAEWEYACRAGTITRYSFGDSLATDPDAPTTTGGKPLEPVANRTPNAFGLFDMHGSVHEMCLDAGLTWTTERLVNPVGSIDLTRPAVVRGGAFSSQPARLRSSQRYLTDSRTMPGDNFATIVKGFRVVCELEPAVLLSPAVPLGPTQLLTSPDHEWSPMAPVEMPGMQAAFGPRLASDGMSLWFHGRENPEVESSRLILWHAWRHATDQPFGEPVPLDASVNDLPGFNLSDVTITADGLLMCFCHSRANNGTEADLWLSSRPSGDASWSVPVPAGPGVNQDTSEWEPELSPDGLELFFHSDRAESSGGADLWVSRRATRDEAFGPAVNAGPAVNSSSDDSAAALSSDGLTLLFQRWSADSDQRLTFWMATRESRDRPFSTTRELTVPGSIARGATSLSLSKAGDRLYAGAMVNGTFRLVVSRRVRKR